MIDDDGEADGEIKALTEEEVEDTEMEGECSIMGYLSLFEEKKWRPRTMKLRGLVKGVPILILVDSGATHNFISKQMVEAMGWAVEHTKPMVIKLGDGYKAISQGQCAGLAVEVGDVSVNVDALLFELEGVDMVLGIAWLATLGGMWVD